MNVQMWEHPDPKHFYPSLQVLQCTQVSWPCGLPYWILCWGQVHLDAPLESPKHRCSQWSPMCKEIVWTFDGICDCHFKGMWSSWSYTWSHSDTLSKRSEVLQHCVELLYTKLWPYGALRLHLASSSSHAGDNMSRALLSWCVLGQDMGITASSTTAQGFCWRSFSHAFYAELCSSFWWAQM